MYVNEDLYYHHNYHHSCIMAEGTTVTMFPEDSQENHLAEEAAGVPHLLLHQEPTGITYQRRVYQLQRLINTAQEIISYLLVSFGGYM